MRRFLVCFVSVMLLGTGALLVNEASPFQAAPLDQEPAYSVLADPAKSFPPLRVAAHPILLADGWATPVNVSNNPSPSGSPSLGVDSFGTVHIAWYDNSPGNWEILYASKSITGAWSLPENVSANASYSLVPSLLIESDDVVDLAWQDYGGPRIAWQGTLLFKYKDPGESFSPPEAISATSGFGGYPEVRDPTLAIDSAKTVHLAWAGSTALGYRILYANKVRNGVWAFPSVINPGYGQCFYPRLAVDGMDTVHAVWQETLPGSLQSDIYYAMRAISGLWSAPINLSQNIGNSQMPWLLISKDGTLHVVWQDNSDSPQQAEIFYTYKAIGSEWTRPVNISQTEGDSAGPVLVEDSSGTLHLVWYDNTPGNWEILYATKPKDGSWTSGANISNTPGRSGQPRIVYDGRRMLHLAWADDTPGDFDILYTSKPVPVFSASFKQAPATALAGDTLAYRLVLRNNSPVPITLFVTDRVPFKTTLVPGSAQATSGTLTETADEVRWSGVVPAEGSVIVGFLAELSDDVPVGDVIRNRASIMDTTGATIDIEAATQVVLVRVVVPIIVQEQAFSHE